MTEDEAQKLMAMLAAYMPGRLPEATQIAWAVELKAYSFNAGLAGVREHARTAEHPSLKDIIDCIDRERIRLANLERQRIDRLALPERAAGLDADRHDRTARAAREARLLVERLAQKKAMPKPDMSAAPPTIARNGHEAQTPQEAELRVRLLREQAERLEREAMQDAFSEEASK